MNLRPYIFINRTNNDDNVRIYIYIDLNYYLLLKYT